LSYFIIANSILHVEMLRRIEQGQILPGWNYLEYLSVGGGKEFSTREILHRRVFHGMHFALGTFCGSNFLLGLGAGLFAGKLFHG
jgi:hypothetical protein